MLTETHSKVSCFETSLVSSYSVNYCPLNRPEKFRGFQETYQTSFHEPVQKSHASGVCLFSAHTMEQSLGVHQDLDLFIIFKQILKWKLLILFYFLFFHF